MSFARRARQVALASTALTAIVGFGSAHAQSTASAPLDEREVIVVTGSAIAAPSDQSLQAVDVLSIDEIIDALDTTLGGSLAALPGVSTTAFGPAVGRPVIRGLGGDRVRILTNGVGAIDASAISADHASTAEALEAERIEILRGPAAIAYGGNAVAGVVNVIDGRVPTAPVTDGLDGQLFTGFTSVDEGAQGAARLRAGVGPFVFQVEGLARSSGDFDIPGFAESARLRALEEEEEGEEHEGEEEAFGVVENSRFDVTQWGAGAAFVGERGFFGVAFKDLSSDYGLPGHEHGHGEEDHEDEDHEEEGHEEEEGEEEGDARIVLDQQRFDIRGALDVDWGPFSRVSLSSAISDYQHAELEPSGEIGTLFENDGWEARVALENGAAGDRLSGSIGVQAFRTDFSATGEEAFVPPVVTEDVGVFAAQRYDLGGWGLEGGLRAERRDLASATGFDRDFTTYSGAAGVFFRPAPDQFVGFNLARTERAPTDAELFSNGPHAATESVEIGDPDLGEETAWAFDAAYHLDLGGWHVEAGAFYTLYQDFIFLAATGETDPDEDLPIFRYLQDDANLWGAELFVEREMGAFGAWSFSGDATLEYVRAETDTLGNLPRIPPFSGIFGLEAERERIGLRAEIEYVAEQDEVSAFELPTDDYTFVNLSAQFAPFDDADVRFIVELMNATDEEGRLHASILKDTIPLPGRNLRVAVAAKF